MRFLGPIVPSLQASKRLVEWVVGQKKMAKSAFSLKQRAWPTAVNEFQLLLLPPLRQLKMSAAKQVLRVDLALHLSAKEVSKEMIRKKQTNLTHMLFLLLL